MLLATFTAFAVLLFLYSLVEAEADSALTTSASSFLMQSDGDRCSHVAVMVFCKSQSQKYAVLEAVLLKTCGSLPWSFGWYAIAESEAMESTIMQWKLMRRSYIPEKL